MMREASSLLVSSLFIPSVLEEYVYSCWQRSTGLDYWHSVVGAQVRELQERGETIPHQVWREADSTHPNLSLESMPDHRASHFTGRGNSESGYLTAVGREMQHEPLSVTAMSSAITPLKIYPTPEPLRRGKAF